MTDERTCGSCNLCCNLLAINEIDAGGKAFAKDGWTLCQYCDTGNAAGCCTIHATRPQTCRQYRCAWLMGFGGPEERPDKTKVLPHPEDSEGFGAMLNLHELEPDVTSHFPPAMAIVEKALQVEWINAVSIISSRTAKRKVYVRDSARSDHWEERWYESFDEQYPEGIPVTDWRKPD